MVKRASLTTAAKPRTIHTALSLFDVDDWQSAGELQILPTAVIDPSPYQSRETYDEQMLEELAASIRDMGIIQPVAVRPKDNGRYELVAGHRRWLAAQRAGKATIPAVIRPLDDQSAAALSLIENLQREDLNPMDAAQGFQRMIDEFGIAQQDLGRLLGRSKADISLTLGLLKLLPEVQVQVRQGKLTAGHGRLLYRLPEVQQRHFAQAAINRGWTVRQLEIAISRQKADIELTPSRDPNIQRIETVLAEYFAVPVKIHPTKRGAGTITLRYHSLDECEAILERFGLKPEQYR